MLESNILPMSNMENPIGKEPQIIPPDKVPKQSRPQKEEMDRFLIFLSKLTNPQTGEKNTLADLVELYSHALFPEFHYSPSTVERVLRENGSYRSIVPQVLHEPLPENQRAFFLGLALGDFTIEKIHWGDSTFIAVETESQKMYRRELLRQTIGTWGETHEKSTGVRIYMDSPTFDFLLDPTVTSHTLDAKIRYAPFLFGLMGARLSERDNRFSLADGKLLEKISKKFIDHFHFSLGSFTVEHRVDRRERRNRVRDLPVITIKEPGKVFRSLAEVKSVCTLPFFRQLAQITNGSSKA